MARISQIISFLIIGLFLVSCTRKLETSAVLNFNFEKVNAGPQAASILPGYYPDMVFVNIQYDGKTHFQKWECPYYHEEVPGYDISDCVLPTSMAMNKTFPPGANRLVQVLLVYSNDQDQMQFFYSDKTLSFSGGNANVSIGDTGWAINASGKEGKVAGRLQRAGVNAADLTGTVVGYYNPSNGRPPIAVIKEQIFAGWFEFMFLEDVYFTYKMETTSEVLINNKRLQDFDKPIGDITTNDLKMLKVVVPEHYEVHSTETNAVLTASDIALIDYAGINGSFTGPDNITALTDGSAATYSYVTAADTLEITLNKFINVSSIDLYYANPGSPTSAAPAGEDFWGSPVTYAGMSITSGAPSGTVSNATVGSPKNAVDFITLSHPYPASSPSYEDIVIKYNKYESYFSAASEAYLLFFDITLNDIPGGATGSQGVSWQAPGAPHYLQQGNLLNLVSDPVVDEAWLAKESDLNAFGNSLYTDVSITVQSTPNEVYIEKSDVNSNCGGPPMNDDCVRYIGQRDKARSAAPFEGPYVSNFQIVCAANCDYSFNYVPGMTGMRSVIFRVPMSYHFDHDEVNCKEMETLGYLFEDLTTFQNMTPVPTGTFNTTFANHKPVICPYELTAEGRKYYNFGRELHQ
jgi:hypothetical protein